jgi:hypothetical protein
MNFYRLECSPREQVRSIWQSLNLLERGLPANQTLRCVAHTAFVLVKP